MDFYEIKKPNLNKVKKKETLFRFFNEKNLNINVFL